MKSKRDVRVYRFGAAVLQRHSTAMRQEMAGVRQAEDSEYVHRMRVASRRLRTAFDLFPMCIPTRRYDGWLKQVRKVTRALGEARDADVQIERLEEFSVTLTAPNLLPGVRRLVLRLRQRRARCQKRVLAALDELESSGMLDALDKTLLRHLPAALEGSLEPATASPSPALYRLAYQSIHDHLEDFLSYNEIVRQPEAIEQLHAMRIAAKRLRYTLEAFAPLYPDELKPYLSAVRKAQECLGDLHDCDVWAEFLPRFLETERLRALDYFGSVRPAGRLKAGIQSFALDRQAARDAAYAEFTQDWQFWQSEHLWDALARAIQPPEAAPNAEPNPSATAKNLAA